MDLTSIANKIARIAKDAALLQDLNVILYPLQVVHYSEQRLGIDAALREFQRATSPSDDETPPTPPLMSPPPRTMSPLSKSPPPKVALPNDPPPNNPMQQNPPRPSNLLLRNPPVANAAPKSLATNEPTSNRKRKRLSTQASTSENTAKKSKNVSKTNKFSPHNRQVRVAASTASLQKVASQKNNSMKEGDEHGREIQRGMIASKWKGLLPSISEAWEELEAVYPKTWSSTQRMVAVDEAVFKLSVLKVHQTLRDLVSAFNGQGLRPISVLTRRPVDIPVHLRHVQELQRFWSLDQEIQQHQESHILSGALLRLSRVRICEEFEDLKYRMRLPGVERKRGQTGAAKAKEMIFKTAYPDEKERSAAVRRFDVAQATAAVLLQLCRDHGYGILALLPPNMREKDIRNSKDDFLGFRAVLRHAFSGRWKQVLQMCSRALLIAGNGQKMDPDVFGGMIEGINLDMGGQSGEEQ